MWYSVSHQDLGGVGAIDRYGVDKQLKDVGVDLAGVRDLTEVLVVDIGLHYGHTVGGEGAGLVGADGRGVAHCLAGIQVAHQVVVLHHFLNKK